MRPPDLPTLRASWWTLRAARRARRALPESGAEPVELPPVPALPPHARRGVEGVLRRTRATCLVAATVRQAWHAAQGEPRDLVIGVTPPGGGFRAHAWLEGDHPCHSAGFEELLRRPAP